MATKAEVLKDPNSCLNRAADDEPIFVLRAHDPLAAHTVLKWAEMARGLHEDEKVEDAIKVYRSMLGWRVKENRGKRRAARERSRKLCGND